MTPPTDARRIDALVAEHILGWRYVQRPYSNAPGLGWESIAPDGASSFGDEKVAPPSSTDIAVAWSIYDVVKSWSGKQQVAFSNELRQLANLEGPMGSRCYNVGVADFIALAFASPMARCLAALQAKGITPTETER